MMTEAKNAQILLVEDSEDDAFFFRRTLQKSGLTCSLTHVTDGGQAVEFLENAASNPENLPHTIFLDLKMPVLNGFEVLEWIRSQSLPSALHVIVLSGSEHEADKQRAAELGAAAYLVKPVRVGDLHRFLQDICPGEMGARV